MSCDICIGSGECQRCEGDGIEPGATETCTRCDGNGECSWCYGTGEEEDD